MKIAVTGSNGLIGRALVQRLTARGDSVVRIVRRSTGAPDEIVWDIAAGRLDGASLTGVDAVVHLAAAGIGDHRWTPAYREEIRRSRVEGTGLLARTLAAGAGPTVLLSASAIGIYGDHRDEILTEDSAVDQRSPSFLADVALEWEQATGPAEEAGVRVVHLRSGVVLSRDGGALAKLLLPFRLGVGGRIGSGRQWWSWISIDDEVAAIEFALGSTLHGAVNLTSPEPARNADFVKALARHLHRPAMLPLPEFAPRILLGRELADQLLFTSARVLPRRLVDAGFAHRHTTLDAAFDAVLAPPHE